MSEAAALERLRSRYEEIRRELESAAPDAGASDRDRLRDLIVGLFRDTEGAITDLEQLKDSIRPLVDRYRELFPVAVAVAQQPGGSAPASGSEQAAAGGDGDPVGGAAAPENGEKEPASIRIDHLGSSTYLERGWNAIASGSYGSAVRELEKALSLAPGHTRAQALLGWALMREDRISEARAVLEDLLARDPDNYLARANLGYVEMREGGFAEAIERLSGIARTTADRTAALYAQLYLGMTYSEREMYVDAEALLTRAIEMGPNLIEAYWELGCARYRAGNRDGACDAWRRGAETNRFNTWGERCGDAADRIVAGEVISLG